MTNDNYSTAEGWLVDVVMPLPGGRRRQQMFAASFQDPVEAVSAVSQHLGALHAAVRPVCRLSTRALGRAGVGTSGVAPMGAAVISRPRSVAPAYWGRSILRFERKLRLVHSVM